VGLQLIHPDFCKWLIIHKYCRALACSFALSKYKNNTFAKQLVIFREDYRYHAASRFNSGRGKTL